MTMGCLKLHLHSHMCYCCKGRMFLIRVRDILKYYDEKFLWYLHYSETELFIRYCVHYILYVMDNSDCMWSMNSNCS